MANQLNQSKKEKYTWEYFPSFNNAKEIRIIRDNCVLAVSDVACADSVKKLVEQANGK